MPFVLNLFIGKFFLYRHIRIDKNVPFYIGIGINNRKTTRTRYYERAYKKDGRNKWWVSIANKTDYEVDILFETNSKEEIIKKEIEFISLYGRRDLGVGTLVNLTNGGDGLLECAEETRQKLSLQKIGNSHGKGKVMSKEQKLFISHLHKGNKYWLGKKRKPSSIEKGASKTRGKVYTQEIRNNLNGTHPNSKKVYCLNNQIVYNSIGECIRLLFECNLLAKENKYRSIKHGISKVCNNKIEAFRKYKFKFV